MTSQPVTRGCLSVQSVSARLGLRAVLNSVSLDVRSGDVVAVAGPNGAGKSTLLRVMAGLHRPQAGRVLLDGRDISLLSRRDLGQRIAYLPQERTVHWPLKGRAVVALGRLPHGTAPGQPETAKDREKIDAALRAADADAFADRPVSELSGGERARVLIARAFAQDANVLLADEPSAGLDPAHALLLFSAFAREAATGRAVVVALHDLSLALRYCSHTLLLKDGHVAASGLTRDVLTEDQIARVYAVSAKVGMIGGVPAVLPVAPLT